MAAHSVKLLALREARIPLSYRAPFTSSNVLSVICAETGYDVILCTIIIEQRVKIGHNSLRAIMPVVQWFVPVLSAAVAVTL